MNNQSILLSIHQAISNIKWKSNLLEHKAYLICQAMFNQFIIDKDNFFTYKQFAQNYFTTVTGSKKYYFIKDILITNGILDCDNRYFFDIATKSKGKAKGYKFSSKFFVNKNYSSTNQTFSNSIFNSFNSISSISLYCPTGDSCKIKGLEERFFNNFITTNMNQLTFENDIDTFIDQLATVRPADLTINNNITEEFIYLVLDNKEYRYSLKQALQFANSIGKELICFNDKYYLNTVPEFIVQQEAQRKIAYAQSIFHLKNQIYYCNRNLTNSRLDYNLTGLKKELFSKIKFEGEPLVELDIANAQFAIAAHINQDIDANFINHAHRGTLYRYIERELKLEAGMGKQLMFRIAFDRVKHDDEFEKVRKLFPKLMTWVDTYKQEHGYKLFANLLQRKESEIMIDGLLAHLIARGFKVFTIHDALRVKQSQANEIMTIMNEYFNTIGFKCTIRQK